MIARGYQRERIWEPSGDWQRNKSGLYLPGEKPARATADLVAIDLFAGAGGFSLGFHESGWHVAAAVEWEPAAAMTYLHNLAGPSTVLHFADSDMKRRWQKALRAEEKRCRRESLPSFGFGRGWIATKPDQKPVEHFYLGDIRAFTAEQMMDDLSIGRGDVGCVFGGPPCQGFSMAGQRNVMDPRNSLVFEFMHFVVEVRPKTFVMENVPGMLTMNTAEGVPVIDMLARIAQDGNFMAADAFRATMKAQAESLGFLRSDVTPRKPDLASVPPTDTGEQLNLLA